MNLIKIFHRFPDQESCIEHLEETRWNGSPICPYCGNYEKISRKQDGKRVGRWNCFSCKSSFNVLSGTIFEKTKVPLQKWFLSISLIMNAKKSLSSYQLARDLEINQKTAWYVLIRIREAMMSHYSHMLQGIVEADETYIGGKPRKGKKNDDGTPNKRGRGTKKIPVVGMIERGSRVMAKAVKKTQLKAKDLNALVRGHVDIKKSVLITDEYKGYLGISKFMNHQSVNHQVCFVDGEIHTNTIEGFWSLVKRAWYGQHHHYSKKYIDHYIAESCYKYNKRNDNCCTFSSFIRLAVS
jgi:transposase-like protein